MGAVGAAVWASLTIGRQTRSIHVATGDQLLAAARLCRSSGAVAVDLDGGADRMGEPGDRRATPTAWCLHRRGLGRDVVLPEAGPDERLASRPSE